MRISEFRSVHTLSGTKKGKQNLMWCVYYHRYRICVHWVTLTVDSSDRKLMIFRLSPPSLFDMQHTSHITAYIAIEQEQE